MTDDDQGTYRAQQAQFLRDKFAKEPETIDVQRLSELLDQGKGTTYKQLSKGQIPAIRKKGGSWLIYSERIRDWLIDNLPKNGDTQ